jgi:hypothetical protein
LPRYRFGIITNHGLNPRLKYFGANVEFSNGLLLALPIWQAVTSANVFSLRSCQPEALHPDAISADEPIASIATRLNPHFDPSVLFDADQLVEVNPQTARVVAGCDSQHLPSPFPHGHHPLARFRASPVTGAPSETGICEPCRLGENRSQSQIGIRNPHCGRTERSP